MRSIKHPKVVNVPALVRSARMGLRYNRSDSDRLRERDYGRVEESAVDGFA